MFMPFQSVGTYSTLLFSYLLIFVQRKLVHNWFHTRGHTHENLMFNCICHINAMLSLFPYFTYQRRRMFLPPWQHAKYKGHTNEYGIQSLKLDFMCMPYCSR